MTGYQRHMQHIHNIGMAMSIESAVSVLMEDVIDYLITSGIKQNSELIKSVRALGKYEYKPENKNSHGN